MTTRRTGPLVRLTACLCAELTILVLVVTLGGERPGSPPIDRSWADWWSGRDPLDAAAGIGRLIVIALTAYLVAVTSIHLAAVIVRGRRLGRLAAALGPRFLVGIAATAALGTAPVLAAEGPAMPGAGATMEVVDQGAARTWLPWATGTVAAPDASPAPDLQTPDLQTPDLQTPEPPPPPPPTTASSEVVVVSGDSMWSIARTELTARLARAPTIAEIDPYWRDLIERNRDRLVHRDEPGLIYPGQVFLLP